VFSGPQDHLDRLLRALDLLLHREILRLRSTYQLSLDEFRGLYISDAHVDALIAERAQASESNAQDPVRLTLEAGQVWEECREHVQPEFPWARVLAEFALDDHEAGILLVALAPDVARKYETLYAYLNDDVSRKTPTVDLAARVLAAAPGERVAIRRRLRPASRLFREGLLVPGSSAGDFHLAPEVSAFLLDLDRPLEPPAVSWGNVRLPEGVEGIAHSLKPDGPLVVLESSDATLAASVAAAACNGWRVPLLTVDASGSEATHSAIERTTFTRRVHRAGLFVAQLDQLIRSTDSSARESLRRVAASFETARGPVFVHVEPGDAWRTARGALRHVHVTLPEPDVEMRGGLWLEALFELGEVAAPEDIAEVAARFRLTSSHIQAAARQAADVRDLEEPGGPIGRSRLFAAARAYSDSALAALARKVPLANSWDDLVLPSVTLNQLREIASAARTRETVYATWGLGRRHPGAGGIKVLFSGQSGTGKTMSAGVIARELGLDLYQIDLSRVVSKYIGETEKNLDRVFNAARGSNAVLFFDEADALFGKRSEVKDAHDRYANIEVGYLLQKMEEYEGIAILATNLGRNIDTAFSRRLQYVVDLPLPDEPLRLRLWRNMFTADTPVAEDVNFPLLARQYKLSGGEIRNVALAAAFLAAGDGQVITMDVLGRVVAREMLRQGRIASNTSAPARR
jgi:hypothetical protein